MNKESEIITMLKTYRQYKTVVNSLVYARKYYSQDFEDYTELIRNYQTKINFIKEFVDSFAPSNIFIILNLHYMNGVPYDKCFECMGISKSTGYRLLKTVEIAVISRYNRITGEPKQ